MKNIFINVTRNFDTETVTKNKNFFSIPLVLFFIFYFLFFISPSPLFSQSIIPSLSINKNEKKAEIPFERQGNFIILKVLFNGLLPLRFMFDTGAEHCILTKKEVASIFQINYEKEIIIRGTDLHTQIKAYIARKVKLNLEGVDLVKDILVLDEDYFKFDKFAGLEIHGIIGAETFRNYVVKLDYIKQIMTIYEPSAFTEFEHRGYDSLDILVLHNKPFINTQAQVETDSVVNLKLLIDTGAGLAMLLYAHSTPGLSPPKTSIEGNIGTGLGGDLTGFMGRLKKFTISGNNQQSAISYQLSESSSQKSANDNVTTGKKRTATVPKLKVQGSRLSFSGVIASFQEMRDLSDTSFLLGRNGILGGEILSRFTTIIDFPKEKIYLKPNRDFNETFKYDKSGINFIAQGENLNKFTVNSVLYKSPASEAKIWRGDELTSFQHIPARLFTLSTLDRRLQGKTGKKIRLVFRRDGKRIVKYIKLRDLL